MNAAAPAFVVLGQAPVPIARQIMTVFPAATLYGLAGRTTDVDVYYRDFGTTLQELFAARTPIVGFCAAGILIRALAPLLTDKFQEPPVLAIAEDGSAVVPLLGGLQGVNDLARQIGTSLKVMPAITTSGDIRFRTALLAPPMGYHLANPEDAKKFIADLLAGATVRLDGKAPWLEQSQLPLAADAVLTLQVTEQTGTPSPNCLVYHPATIAIGFSRSSTENQSSEIITQAFQQLLSQHQIAPASLAGIFAQEQDMGDPIVEALAQTFQLPVRFLPSSQATAEQLARQVTGESGQLLCPTMECDGVTLTAIAAAQPIDPQAYGRSRGRLAIVGTGPGGSQWMSPEAKTLLREATDLVGYGFYLDLAGPLQPGQQRHESDNREELDRARLALDLAAMGRSVAVVSSGDPGIFAMAAAVFEVLEREAKSEWESIEIRVSPGISALQAAAALSGAPIGHDFCVISLSDILKPWPVIEQRIAAAAAADLVIAFYNPASKHRSWQLIRAKEVLLQTRSPQTLVILGRNLGRPEQSVRVVTLGELNPAEVDMRTTVLVGSSQTRQITRKSGQVWAYTPRHYPSETPSPLP